MGSTAVDIALFLILKIDGFWNRPGTNKDVKTNSLGKASFGSLTDKFLTENVEM
jgi:hypothetical protein